MSYDPNYPPTGAEIQSAPLRDQFTGLKDLIDAVPTLNAAVIDSVTPLPPGSAPTVGLAVTAPTMHFTFALPVGIDSAVIDSVTTLPPGQPVSVSLGLSGTVLHFSFAIPQGAEGQLGATGPAGEVTNSTLNAAIGAVVAGSSANSNGVALLGLVVSDPPAQAEMQAVANKLDELINALRRST